MRNLALVLLAATAPAIAGAQSTVGSVPIQTDGTILEVSAEGRTSRVPDLATIRAGVVTQSPTASAALTENAARMARVLASLKRAGIADRDLQTANVSLNPQYRYVNNQPPQLTGYQASNTVSVRFRDIAKAGPILDILVKEGANQIEGPNLSLDNPDAALDEARTDAIKRARDRAELYAKAAGMRVARILSIGEGGENAGGPQPPVMFARAAKLEQQSDTAIVAGERDVTATVNVRFLLK